MAKLVTHFTRLMNDSYIKYEDQRKNRIGIFHGNNRTNVTHTHHTLFTISLALAGNSMCTTENTTPFVRESIAGHWFSYQNASQSTYTRLLVAHTIYLSIYLLLFAYHFYSIFIHIITTYWRVYYIVWIPELWGVGDTMTLNVKRYSEILLAVLVDCLLSSL